MLAGVTVQITSVGRVPQFWLVDDRFYHHVTVAGTYFSMHKTETWKLDEFFCLICCFLSEEPLISARSRYDSLRNERECLKYLILHCPGSVL